MEKKYSPKHLQRSVLPDLAKKSKFITSYGILSKEMATRNTAAEEKDFAKQFGAKVAFLVDKYDAAARAALNKLSQAHKMRSLKRTKRKARG